MRSKSNTTNAALGAAAATAAADALRKPLLSPSSNHSANEMEFQPLFDERATLCALDVDSAVAAPTAPATRDGLPLAHLKAKIRPRLFRTAGDGDLSPSDMGVFSPLHESLLDVVDLDGIISLSLSL